MRSCLSEARAQALVPQWVLRPFWAHERSKPGARYATRCFSESCLSESCLSEALSGTTLRTKELWITARTTAPSRAKLSKITVDINTLVFVLGHSDECSVTTRFMHACLPLIVVLGSLIGYIANTVISCGSSSILIRNENTTFGGSSIIWSLSDNQGIREVHCSLLIILIELNRYSIWILHIPNNSDQFPLNRSMLLAGVKNCNIRKDVDSHELWSKRVCTDDGSWCWPGPEVQRKVCISDGVDDERLLQPKKALQHDEGRRELGLERIRDRDFHRVRPEVNHSRISVNVFPKTDQCDRVRDIVIREA